MKWTTEQQNAISLPVSDMIVSAAAGSGKTAVMAERVLQRLTGDKFVDIDKILVVTYTSAAASEIKERIMQKIVEKLKEGSNEALASQLLKLPYAHISTIHSFCLDLIRKYFYLLNLDPAVNVADETEVDTIKRNAASIVFNNHYDNADELFVDFVSDYSSKNDNSLIESVISVYDFSRTMPDSTKWLQSIENAYSSTNTKACDFLMKCASMAAELAVTYYDEGIALCKNNEDCEIMANVLETERNLVVDAINSPSYTKMKEVFNSITFVDWRKVSGNELVRKEVYDKRDSAKSVIVKDVLGKYLVLSYDEICTDNEKILPYAQKLTKLVLEFAQVYEELKKEKNILDFSDFEHLALKLLRNPDGSATDVANEVSAQFEEIYIDEYQDCNNIQNTIFEYVSGSRRGCPNVFCVGDMKQSIYSFRDSNPLLFLDKCDSFPLFDGKTVNSANKILLNSNFRSRKTVLGFVNSVFSQIMSRECGELDYDDNEKLNYGGGYEDVNPDTDFIDIDIIDSSNTFGSSYAPDEASSLSAIEAEAYHVASKIKEYVSSGYMLYNKKTGIASKAQYCDIVVLLRSVSTPAPVFEKVFSEMGIPVYCDRGTPYFDTEEISFLLSLLKVIDNPDDDISLAATLKNPVFGFDENDLLKMRLASRKTSFYECAKKYSAEDDLSEKLQRFFAKLDDYYIKSRYMDTDEFLCYVIKDLNYYMLLSVYPDSELKKTNVRFLLKKAREFETNKFKGIYSFVRYIENFKEKDDAESAKILSENDNVVRIMSIHKSKGLEFPIVFVSCLGRQFNTQSQRKKFVMHRDFGLGMECVYRDAAIRIKSANMLAIKRKIAFEAASEELRVLYVALTRPTEKLVLTASVSKGAQLLANAEKVMSQPNVRLNPYMIYSSSDFIQILLYAAVRSEGYPRDFSDNNASIIRDGCKYHLTLKNICEIQAESQIKTGFDWRSQYDGPTNNYQSIESVLGFSYPYASSVNAPTNMTVTELKRLALETEGTYELFDDVQLAVPSEFGSGRNIAGASFGTLVHFVMEKLDFQNTSTPEMISEQLTKLCSDSLISEEELSCVDAAKFYSFFTSDLGRRMTANSHTLQREYSFKYLADASEIFEASSDDRLVIQGTVDAFFIDNDGSIVIVDYKTDKVIGGNSSIIADRYRTQLDYYAKALEITFNRPVKEKILYLFDTGEAINV